MALPAPFPLTGDKAIYIGDTYQFSVIIYDTVLDPDTGKYVKGDPIDLTGCTVRAQVRPSKRKIGEVDVPSVPFDITNADDLDDSGQIDLVLRPEDTISLGTDKAFTKGGFWDLEVTFTTEAGGEPVVKTIISGAVELQEDVTR